MREASAMYHYFISFFVYPVDSRNQFPFRNMGHQRPTPITTLEDIRKVEHIIEQELVVPP